MANPPQVSVIIAAYGRPEVLPYAIGSALGQTLREIEVIVVGDCAGENIASVVRSFDDPRLRFHDLPINYGEQSGPNNIGADLARADTIAFLNQDDIWFPDHLDVALTWLRAAACDLVYAHGAVMKVEPGGDCSQASYEMTGNSPTGPYDPIVTYAPASTQLLRRHLHRELGGWRPGAECRGDSSQDFCVRAWRSGARMRAVPHLSAILIQSGARRDSYVESDSSAHDWLSSAMRADPEALRASIMDRSVLKAKPLTLPRRMNRAARRLLVRLGFQPQTLRVRPSKRAIPGTKIARLRQTKGLPPLLRSASDLPDLRFAHILRQKRTIALDEPVDFGNAGQGRWMRLRGWATPSRQACRTNADAAELLILPDRIPRNGIVVELRGTMVGSGTSVEVLTGARRLATWPPSPATQREPFRAALDADMFSPRERYAVLRLEIDRGRGTSQSALEVDEIVLRARPD